MSKKHRHSAQPRHAQDPVQTSDVVRASSEQVTDVADSEEDMVETRKPTFEEFIAAGHQDRSVELRAIGALSDRYVGNGISVRTEPALYGARDFFALEACAVQSLLDDDRVSVRIVD